MSYKFWIDKTATNLWFKINLQPQETKKLYIIKDQQQQDFQDPASVFDLFFDFNDLNGATTSGDVQSDGEHLILDNKFKDQIANIGTINTYNKVIEIFGKLENEYNIYGLDQYNEGVFGFDIDSIYLAGLRLRYDDGYISLFYSKLGNQKSQLYRGTEEYPPVSVTGKGQGYVVTAPENISWFKEELLLPYSKRIQRRLNGSIYEESGYIQPIKNAELEFIVKESELNSRFYIDYVAVRKYQYGDIDYTIEDKGTYYEVTLTNNTRSWLSEHQIKLPANQFGISSENDQVFIVDKKEEKYYSITVENAITESNSVSSILTNKLLKTYNFYTYLGPKEQTLYAYIKKPETGLSQFLNKFDFSTKSFVIPNNWQQVIENSQEFIQQQYTDNNELFLETKPIVSNGKQKQKQYIYKSLTNPLRNITFKTKYSVLSGDSQNYKLELLFGQLENHDIRVSITPSSVKLEYLPENISAEKQLQIQQNKYYIYTVEVEDNRITLFVNGQHACSLTASQSINNNYQYAIIEYSYEGYDIHSKTQIEKIEINKSTSGTYEYIDQFDRNIQFDYIDKLGLHVVNNIESSGFSVIHLEGGKLYLKSKYNPDFVGQYQYTDSFEQINNVQFSFKINTFDLAGNSLLFKTQIVDSIDNPSDYITIEFDNSNVVTLSGSINGIDISQTAEYEFYNGLDYNVEVSINDTDILLKINDAVVISYTHQSSIDDSLFKIFQFGLKDTTDSDINKPYKEIEFSNLSIGNSTQTVNYDFNISDYDLQNDVYTPSPVVQYPSGAAKIELNDKLVYRLFNANDYIPVEVYKDLSQYNVNSIGIDFQYSIVDNSTPQLNVQLIDNKYIEIVKLTIDVQNKSITLNYKDQSIQNAYFVQSGETNSILIDFEENNIVVKSNNVEILKLETQDTIDTSQFFKLIVKNSLTSAEQTQPVDITIDNLSINGNFTETYDHIEIYDYIKKEDIDDWIEEEGEYQYFVLEDNNVSYYIEQDNYGVVYTGMMYTPIEFPLKSVQFTVMQPDQEYVAPLEMGVFNENKSPVVYLEYGADQYLRFYDNGVLQYTSQSSYPKGQFHTFKIQIDDSTVYIYANDVLLTSKTLISNTNDFKNVYFGHNGGYQPSGLLAQQCQKYILDSVSIETLNYKTIPSQYHTIESGKRIIPFQYSASVHTTEFSLSVDNKVFKQIKFRSDLQQKYSNYSQRIFNQLKNSGSIYENFQIKTTEGIPATGKFINEIVEQYINLVHSSAVQLKELILNVKYEQPASTSEQFKALLNARIDAKEKYPTNYNPIQDVIYKQTVGPIELYTVTREQYPIYCDLFNTIIEFRNHILNSLSQLYYSQQVELDQAAIIKYHLFLQQKLYSEFIPTYKAVYNFTNKIAEYILTDERYETIRMFEIKKENLQFYTYTTQKLGNQKIVVLNELFSNLYLPFFIIFKQHENVVDQYIIEEQSFSLTPENGWTVINTDYYTKVFDVVIPTQQMFSCEIEGNYHINGNYNKIGNIVYQYGPQTLSFLQDGEIRIRNMFIHDGGGFVQPTESTNDKSYITYNIEKGDSFVFQFYQINTYTTKTIFDVNGVTVQLKNNKILLNGEMKAIIQTDDWNVVGYDTNSGYVYLFNGETTTKFMRKTSSISKLDVGHKNGDELLHSIVYQPIIFKDRMNQERFEYVQRILYKTLKN